MNLALNLAKTMTLNGQSTEEQQVGALYRSDRDHQRPDILSGVVRAYNIRTGEFAWSWNPVHPDHPQRDEDGNFVSGTTNVWSTISVDGERNLVIVPTGNSSPDIYGGNRDGHLDYYSSSVVALNAADGTVAWHYQTVHHDIWDYDVASQQAGPWSQRPAFLTMC